MTGMHIGLLILRVGIGAMFVVYGWPKLTGGAGTWAQLGGAMQSLGIGFAPVFWGFMAAVAECIGGIALVLGLFVRPFALLMTITMAVATLMLIEKGGDLQRYGHALSMGIVFLSLTLMGGGRYAIGNIVQPLTGQWYR